MLTQQLVQLFTSLFEQVEVVFSQSPGVDDHFGEISDVLFDGIAHFLHRDHMMTIVLVVHACCAHSLRALFAKVFDAFVWVNITRNNRNYTGTCLVCLRQDREQLKIRFEKFWSTDVHDFLTTDWA